MPANAGKVDDVHFLAVWLLHRCVHANAEFFHQPFFFYLLIEIIGAGNIYSDHKVFCKILMVIVLQNKTATVFFKSYVVARIPANLETKVDKKLPGACEVLAGWNKGLK